MEKLIEQRITEFIASLGGRAVKLQPAIGRGFPDRTVLLPRGTIVFLEVKQPGGHVSRHQRHWLSTLRSLGFIAEVVESVDDARAAVEKATRFQGMKGVPDDNNDV